MLNENNQPESSEKKKRVVPVRDLKLKSDPKGGGATDTETDDKGPSGRKGEADFMQGLR